MTSDGSTAGRAPPGADAGPGERSRPPWLRPVVIVVIVVVCGWLATTFLGAIDWSSVGEALGRLTAWQVLVLLVVLLVRQTLNALPLALFIDGLSAVRALLNDLVASLMAVVAPPPSDLVVRVAMFRTWGIEASRGLAGATMNMLAFYVNRFAAPLIGLAVLAVLGNGTQRGGRRARQRSDRGRVRWSSSRGWSAGSSSPPGWGGLPGRSPSACGPPWTRRHGCAVRPGSRSTSRPATAVPSRAPSSC